MNHLGHRVLALIVAMNRTHPIFHDPALINITADTGPDFDGAATIISENSKHLQEA
jgi:hypothetical protein